MDIVQTFYDNLASQYHKLFLDWQSATREQAVILSKIFEDNGFDRSARVLDCACGIGTQSVGLALLGYDITASDISEKELAEAKIRAKKNNVEICFERANFCNLSETFSNKFDIVIAMDNALPHMLTKSKLENAVKSITNQIATGGIFVASIRDYDALLEQKPPFSAPYIHKTDNGQRVSFQTWQWKGDNYKLVQYIIDDEDTLQVAKFECEYRATRRKELTDLLISNGCSKVVWVFPEDSGFYQPIVIAKK
ncbi:MAG: class I SAM-dependent methyltransferase [Clostridia bacterium]|nr:class I SAM-dependent methyltransferase [Clostridia bacterium]